MVMSEVSDLLKQSIALHNAAKPVTVGKGSARRTIKPRDNEKLRHAYELRKKAHEMDSSHLDPVWGEEQAVTSNGRDTHAMLMRFYEEQLG